MRVLAVACFLLLGVDSALSQVQWQQSSAAPQSVAYLPAGLKVEVLGIEFGDTPDVVKQKLQGIIQRNNGNSTVNQMTGAVFVDRPAIPNAYSAQYTARLSATLNARGTPGDSIDVWFSAPASGNQVVAIQRFINAIDPAQYVSIAELVASLSEKFKAQPQTASVPPKQYWIWKAGKQVNLKDPTRCGFIPSGLDGSVQVTNIIRSVSPDGECDFTVNVYASPSNIPGKSGSIVFYYIDHARIKNNAQIDEQYVVDQATVRMKQQQQAPGFKPKL